MIALHCAYRVKNLAQAEAQKEKERKDEEAAKEEATRKKEELRQAELAELDVSSSPGQISDQAWEGL